MDLVYAAALIAYVAAFIAVMALTMAHHSVGADHASAPNHLLLIATPGHLDSDGPEHGRVVLVRSGTPSA
ncbi:hypothetical protein [Actinoplanes sp. ATCC 53533]|uniref:hypothetical protein n=1 Tax=Actinoplanes sp. ATCC 53533 TaxID=1288362 RepID=UPI0013156886|nr:hypothetical protein [Actinoplanes sp. ATCC 53533]